MEEGKHSNPARSSFPVPPRGSEELLSTSEVLGPEAQALEDKRPTHRTRE